MTVETSPSRETTSQRELRRAVGRQVGVTILFCAASLITGIAIGHFYLQKQMQVQQGLVGQLQREIRGLTGDIQRLELEGARNLARFEQSVDRLEKSRVQELTGAFRGAQDRLDSLQRMVERQVESTQQAEAGCLAEFEAYRSRHLAVPVELIVEAVERLTSLRTKELAALLEEVEAQADAERSRLAALEGSWLMGSDHVERVRPAESDLKSPVTALIPAPSIRPADAVASTSVVTSAVTELTTTVPPKAMPGSVLTALTPSESAEPVFSVTSDAASITVEPVPENALPAPRPLLGAAGRRRGFGQLISFGSGRRVDMTPPQRSPSHAPTITTATATTEEESR